MEVMVYISYMIRNYTLYLNLFSINPAKKGPVSDSVGADCSVNLWRERAALAARSRRGRSPTAWRGVCSDEAQTSGGCGGSGAWCQAGGAARGGGRLSELCPSSRFLQHTARELVTVAA